MDDVAIGIDLGTTYCCMSVYRDGKVEIIPNSYDKNKTPSYVHIDENDSVTAGPAAKGLALHDLTRVVYDVKRMIGRRFNDPVVQKDMEIWPFKVIEDDDTSLPRILVNETAYSPKKILAHVLIYLKECAEKWLNRPVKKAVITVPAYFNDLQRQATKLAGSLAGLDVLELLHEPTAATVYYCYKNKSFQAEKTILVFDLGGGTLDVVVMTIEDRNIVIKAIGGDSHLGGQDIDRILVDHCLQEFKAKNGIDINSVASGKDEVKVARLLRRLKTECEEVKTQLSYNKKSVISLDNLHGDTSLSVKITREEFDNLNDALYMQCVNTVKSVVKEAKLTPGDIDEVIMVGGSSKIPKLQEFIMGLFQGEMLNKPVNAEKAVARGAAIYAALMLADCPILKSIFPDIQIRDVVSASVDSKPASTPSKNKRSADSVDDEIPSQSSPFKIYKQEENSKSDSSTEIPKPILASANEVEIPDEIVENIQIIENGLTEKDVNEIQGAWEKINTLTEESPSNCEKFLQYRGIDAFLNCFRVFPCGTSLLKSYLYPFGNVAKVGYLRPQLMTSELIDIFYNFLVNPWSVVIEYYATEFLAHILSDGEAAWTIESPRRTDVLSEIRRNVACWEDGKNGRWSVSSVGPCLKLLNATHTTECQLFAAWSLKNCMESVPLKYVYTLEELGGLDILDTIISDNQHVHKWASIILEISNKYLSE